MRVRARSRSAVTVRVERIAGRAVRTDLRHGGGRALGGVAPWNKLCAGRFDVVGDPSAGRVVADVGQQIDIAVQLGQSHRDIERAAADMLGFDRTIDDVDQGFADHQRARHVDRLR